MITACVGVGNGEDAFQAGVEACTDALSGLPDKTADILFVFGSIVFDQDKLIEGISSVSGKAVLVGCTTAGEISSDGLSTNGTVVILGIRSDQMNFFSSVGHHISWNAKEAGSQIAGNIQYNSNGYAKTCLMFLDVLSGKGEEVLRGAVERFGQEFQLFGSAAGDDELYYGTYQYLGNKAFTGSVVGVGFTGTYTLGYGIEHGFLPIGLSRIVTRSEGVMLHELDGKPAIEIYKDYFGEEHLNELREGILSGLAVTYPLGVSLPGKPGRILRNPLYVDARGSITFSAEIPEGAEVRLMLSGREEALASAEKAAKSALAMLAGKTAKAILVINSNARKKLLTPNADDEIRTIQQVVGRDVPIAGFYSYAQLGGMIDASELPFHNSTIIVLALAE